MTWLREASWNISCDLSILGNVTKNSDRFIGACGLFDVSYLTLMAVKPIVCSSLAMFSAGVLPGKCRITGFIGFTDFG
jgi:hypothetical protein